MNLKFELFFIFLGLLQLVSVQSLDCSTQRTYALNCNSKYQCRTAVIVMINCFLTSFSEESTLQHYELNQNVSLVEADFQSSREDLLTEMEDLEEDLATCSCVEELDAMIDDINEDVVVMQSTLEAAETLALECHCQDELAAAQEELLEKITQVSTNMSGAQDYLNAKIDNITSSVDSLLLEFENMTSSMAESLESILNGNRSCTCCSEIQSLQSNRTQMEAEINASLGVLESLASQCSCEFNLTGFEEEHGQNVTALTQYLDRVQNLTRQCSCTNEIQMIIDQHSLSCETFNNTLSGWHEDITNEVERICNETDILRDHYSSCFCEEQITDAKEDFESKLETLRQNLSSIDGSEMQDCRCINEFEAMQESIISFVNSFITETENYFGNLNANISTECTALENATEIYCNKVTDLQHEFDVTLNSTPECACEQSIQDFCSVITNGTEANAAILQDLLNRLNSTQGNPNWNSDLQDFDGQLAELKEEIARILYLSTQCSCGYEIEVLETSITDQLVANEDDACSSRKRIECLELDGKYCPRMRRCLSRKTFEAKSSTEGKFICEEHYGAKMLTLTNTNCSDIVSCDVRARNYSPEDNFSYTVLTPGPNGEFLCSRLDFLGEDFLGSEEIPCDLEQDQWLNVFCEFTA